MRQEAAQTGGHGYSDDIRKSTWCNGSTLAQNARDVGSISALGTIFPIFNTHNASCHDHDPVQAMRCMVFEPNLCMYMYGHCLYACKH